MTQEDKELLLKDLCGRLQYKVRVSVNGGKESCTLKGMFDGEHTGMMLILEPSFPSKDVSPRTSNWQLSQCKPYLRPMSSMTEEEKREIYNWLVKNDVDWFDFSKLRLDEILISFDSSWLLVNWLLKNHFDFMDLIPKGLAISTEEFNPYKD